MTDYKRIAERLRELLAADTVDLCALRSAVEGDLSAILRALELAQAVEEMAHGESRMSVNLPGNESSLPAAINAALDAVKA